MKVLIVHNTYQYGGGEDIAASNEARLLIEHGHQVAWYRRSNNELRGMRGRQNLLAGMRTIWSSESYRAMKDLLRVEKPDIVHVHNIFPLMSPAVYFACAQERVPIVQTLHNYRLLCPAATFFRDGHICEECLHRTVPWPGVYHGCYRHSALASGAVAGMLTAHRLLGTWRTKVDCYIALTEFARGKFISGGLPADRIHVKPNFVYSESHSKDSSGEYALFVGRLSEEKGLSVLLDAWKQLEQPIPLVLAGEGPLNNEVVTAQSFQKGNITLLGQVDRDRIISLMSGARFLVFPSLLYEGFPMSIVEAFACMLPVVASRLGAMQEIITHAETGMLSPPGDSTELARQVKWAWGHPDEMKAMGRAARTQFDTKYTSEKNYELLMNVYEFASRRVALSKGTRSNRLESSCKVPRSQGVWR